MEQQTTKAFTIATLGGVILAVFILFMIFSSPWDTPDTVPRMLIIQIVGIVGLIVIGVLVYFTLKKK